MNIPISICNSCQRNMEPWFLPFGITKCRRDTHPCREQCPATSRHLKERIVFKDKQGSFAHIKETLVREFPNLKTPNGAFEFMRADRGGACRPLLPIPMQTVGYTIPFLRDAVGSGIIYVRPIQYELSLDQDITPSTSSSEDAVMTQCINCHKSIPLHSLVQWGNQWWDTDKLRWPD